MENVIIKIRNELIRSISGIDSWFDREDALLEHRCGTDSKSVRELLEDVMHVNRHLLQIIDGARINAPKSALVDVPMENYCLQTQLLDDAAIHKRLQLGLVSHQGGKTELSEVRHEIREQLDRCLIHLELLLAGEGIAFKTKLAIGDLGELDVYHSIYFLAVNTKRYLSELDKMLQDFNQTMENA